MEKQFASGYQRNEDGWILFPRDQAERKSLFYPEEVMEHPAKMNFHLQQAIIEYIADEGQVLLDPFGGTGTLMIAALQGMRVILIDIEEGYHQLQQEALTNLRAELPEAAELITLLHGDCRFTLPIPCNHIITSPPYAQALWDDRTLKGREFDSIYETLKAYNRDSRNLSRLNQFLYNQAMEKVYSLCYDSILPGGTLTTVTKDRIVKRERVLLSKWIDKVCVGLGFRLELWEKWLAPGHAFKSVQRSRGDTVVDDEDIMCWRK